MDIFFSGLDSNRLSLLPKRAGGESPATALMIFKKHLPILMKILKSINYNYTSGSSALQRQLVPAPKAHTATHLAAAPCSLRQHPRHTRPHIWQQRTSSHTGSKNTIALAIWGKRLPDQPVPNWGRKMAWLNDQEGSRPWRFLC